MTADRVPEGLGRVAQRTENREQQTEFRRPTCGTGGADRQSADWSRWDVQADSSWEARGQCLWPATALQALLRRHPITRDEGSLSSSPFWRRGPGEEGGELTADAARERQRSVPNPGAQGEF